MPRGNATPAQGAGPPPPALTEPPSARPPAPTVPAPPLPRAPLEVTAVGIPRRFERLENALVVFLWWGNDNAVGSPVLLHAGKATRFDAILGDQELDGESAIGLWGLEGHYPNDIYARISDSTQIQITQRPVHLAREKWRTLRTRRDPSHSPLHHPRGYKPLPAPASLKADCDFALEEVLGSEQLGPQSSSAKPPSGPRVSVGKRCQEPSDVAAEAPFALELWSKAGEPSVLQVLPVPRGSEAIGGGMAGSTLVLGYRNGPDANILYWDTEQQKATPVAGVPSKLSSMCVLRGGEFWATDGESLWQYSSGKWIKFALPDFGGTTGSPDVVACLGDDLAVIATLIEPNVFGAYTTAVYWSGAHDGILRPDYMPELPEGVEQMH